MSSVLVYPLSPAAANTSHATMCDPRRREGQGEGQGEEVKEEEEEEEEGGRGGGGGRRRRMTLPHPILPCAMAVPPQLSWTSENSIIGIKPIS